MLSGVLFSQAKAILKNIGFPKFISNDTLVRHYYKGVGHSFTMNVRILNHLIIEHL